MFCEVHDDGYTRFYLDERLPCDFARRLLTELYALSTPMRAGIIGALARRGMSVGEIVDEELSKSRRDVGGNDHGNGVLRFDYVAEHRLKVDFHPRGHLDPWGVPTARGRGGLPVVVSRDFDQMYGRGSLGFAIRLALTV